MRNSARASSSTSPRVSSVSSSSRTRVHIISVYYINHVSPNLYRVRIIYRTRCRPWKYKKVKIHVIQTVRGNCRAGRSYRVTRFSPGSADDLRPRLEPKPNINFIFNPTEKRYVNYMATRITITRIIYYYCIILFCQRTFNSLT